MSMNFLEKILENEPSFRKQQVEKAIFQDLIIDWARAGNLPKSLRKKLSKDFPLDLKAEVLVSQKSASIKIALLLNDGLRVEAVLMRHKNKRNTVCVSSQVGCSTGCQFCLTGKSGLKRSLAPFEIIQQVLFFARLLGKENQRVSNIVFMGMGEPLLNYENVMEAIKILRNKNCFGISQRKISISTVGIPEMIKKLAQEKIKPNLAISLHTANQALREKLMPIAKKYSLIDLQQALDFYIRETSQRIMFEYLMLSGVNDSEKDAILLARFVKQFKAPADFRQGKNFYFVNLIAYNDFKSQDVAGFKPSSRKKIQRFKELLAGYGIETIQRYKFGEDVKGACGQLAFT